MTARQFADELILFQRNSELEKVQRSFVYDGVESKFLGIPMADLFVLIMHRFTLRYAIEKLDKNQRDHYLNLKNEK